MSRRLLRLTLAAGVGYGFCWADRAYGHTPILLLLLVAAVSWRPDAAHAALPLSLAVATAQKERDDAYSERDTACSIAVSVQEGGSYEPVPLYVDKPDADRLNRRLRVIP